MADDERRPEHSVANNANKQQYRDHDRRNEVFHGPSLASFSVMGGLDPWAVSPRT